MIFKNISNADANNWKKGKGSDNTIYLLKLIIMRSVCDADYAKEHYEFTLC